MSPALPPPLGLDVGLIRGIKNQLSSWRWEGCAGRGQARLPVGCHGGILKGKEDLSGCIVAWLSL